MGAHYAREKTAREITLSQNFCTKTYTLVYLGYYVLSKLIRVVCVKLTCMKLTHFPKVPEPLTCVKMTHLQKYLDFFFEISRFFTKI